MKKARTQHPFHTPFNRIVVLRNPASTHATQSNRHIAELQKMFGTAYVTVLDTVPGGQEANRKLLCKQAHLLGPHTLFGIAAGDGTVGMVIETLVQDPSLPEQARRTPILPLWGGNANDLAHMLNGPSHRTRLRDILAKGEIVAIHPLACRLSVPQSTPVTRIAACYASFGATAFAAARLNDPHHRKHPLQWLPGGRFIAEIVTGLSALLEAPTFTVKEQGNLKVVYERTFTNGSRFAKIERLPLKLTDGVFYLQTLENKKIVSALPHIFALMQKRWSSAFMHDHAGFTVQQTTLAQFDGEPVEIVAGTKVNVTLSEQPFYALSTLL